MMSMFSFGPFTLDVERRVISKNGEPLRLTLKCVELLAAFVQHAGHTLTKQELIDAAWHDPSASDATLAQHVFLLRRALECDGTKWIETVPQTGYRFTGQVSVQRSSGGGALQEYLEGARAFRSLMTEQSLRSAIDLYGRAIAVDANSAAAYAGRASSLRLLAECIYADPLSCLREARSDAAAALARDPWSADALLESACLSALFDRDWQSASRYLEHARRRYPDHTLVEQLGVYLPIMRGDAQAALEAAAGRPGPLMGAALYFSHEYDRAQPHLEIAAANDPAAHLMLGAARLFGGQPERAIADFRSIYRAEVDVTATGRPYLRQYALAFLIYATARHGDRAQAAVAIADLSRLARERYVSPMARAVAYAGMGDREHARAFVEEAVSRFDPWAAYIALDPFLDILREDARFGRLIERLAA